jgi:hypothetical protein
MRTCSGLRAGTVVGILAAVLCLGSVSPAFATTSSEVTTRVKAAQRKLDAAYGDYKKFDAAATYANSTVVWLQSAKVKKVAPKRAVAQLQAKYSSTLVHCWDRAYASCLSHRSIEDLARIWRWWSRSGAGNRYRLGSYAISPARRTIWRNKIRNASNYEITASSVHTLIVQSVWLQPIRSWTTIPQTTFTAKWDGSPDPSVAYKTQAITESLDCDKAYSHVSGTAVVTLSKTSSENSITAAINPKLSEWPDDTGLPLAPLSLPMFMYVGINYDWNERPFFDGTVEIHDEDGVRTAGINGDEDTFNSVGFTWLGRPGLPPFYHNHEGGGISGAGWLTPLSDYQASTTWPWNGSGLAEWTDSGRLAVSVDAPILSDDLEVIGWDKTSCTIQFKPK